MIVSGVSTHAFVVPESVPVTMPAGTVLAGTVLAGTVLADTVAATAVPPVIAPASRARTLTARQVLIITTVTRSRGRHRR
jgi:hypothetical protein